MDESYDANTHWLAKGNHQKQAGVPQTLNVNCLCHATMSDSEKDVEISERLDTGESVSGDGDQQDLPHPWPYLTEFFYTLSSFWSTYFFTFT